jgi:hypothetical protein
MPAVVNGAGPTDAVPSVGDSSGGAVNGDSSASNVAGTGEKKQKLTRNQMKRMKKKEKKAGERGSRETSVAIQSESETKGVRLSFSSSEVTCP